jgi:hypothetical protein
MIPETTETTKPKHTRRSRRPLIWQVNECHLLIDRELGAGTEKPARLTLLKAKLDSLMILLAREDSAKKKELPAKVEDVPQTKPDPLDAVVAEMLKKHTSPAPRSDTPRGFATMDCRVMSNPSPRPIPVAPVVSPVAPQIDSDLLI